MTDLLAEMHLEEKQIVVLTKFLRKNGQDCLSRWRED